MLKAIHRKKRLQLQRVVCTIILIHHKIKSSVLLFTKLHKTIYTSLLLLMGVWIQV